MMTLGAMHVRRILIALACLPALGCPKTTEAPAEEATREKTYPARQLDTAKQNVDAATRALEQKSNQVGEASLAN